MELPLSSVTSYVLVRVTIFANDLVYRVWHRGIGMLYFIDFDKFISRLFMSKREKCRLHTQLMLEISDLFGHCNYELLEIKVFHGHI